MSFWIKFSLALRDTLKNVTNVCLYLLLNKYIRMTPEETDNNQSIIQLYSNREQRFDISKLIPKVTFRSVSEKFKKV